MRAGIARQIITPPVGTDLTGYVGRPGPSTKVHDELTATAIVLDDGAEKIEIISLDLLGTEVGQDRALREAISKATGIKQTNLLIGSSHTHAGPAIGVLRQCGEPNEAFVRYLWAQVLAAATEANDNLLEAEISFVQAESDLGWNRREWVIGDKVQQSPTSGVITDHQIGGLLIKIANREPVMIFNYTCHGVIMGNDNTETSADWIGQARKMLESSGKIGTAMFLQGCCGNTNPRYRGDFEKARTAGESVAKPLLDALPSAKPMVEPKIAVAWKDIELPYMPLPPEDELEQQITFRQTELQKAQAEGQPLVNIQINRAMLGWAQDALRMAREGGPESVKIGLQAMRIGDVVLAALPGEAFCEYGIGFRKATDLPVMPVGYANGNIGYIPTAEAYKEGGYEVENAIKYYAVKMIAPESEGIISSAMSSLIGEIA